MMNRSWLALLLMGGLALAGCAGPDAPPSPGPDNNTTFPPPGNTTTNNTTAPPPGNTTTNNTTAPPATLGMEQEGL